MITTLTLNASIDKAYYMEKPIENGTVMRIARVHNSAGGKGLNVARVIKICGSSVKATGLVGGFNGKHLESMLDEDQIPHDFGTFHGETRSCINILDPAHGSTEYLEPGDPVTEKELEEFLKKFETVIADSDVVTISGSAPVGAPKDVYRAFVETAKKNGKFVILDTSGDYLHHGLLSKPDMIKPNKEELEDLLGIRIRTEDDIRSCAQKLHEDGIPYVAVSLGADGALLVCSDGTYKSVPPKIDVVNTVGCGDSMVAGFAVAIEQHLPPAQALLYASSVASANALSPYTGHFDPAIQRELYNKGTFLLL